MGVAGSIGKRLMTGAEVAFNGWMVLDGFDTARKEGHGVAYSAMSGISDAVLPNVLGWRAYMGGYLAMKAPGAAVDAMEAIDNKGRSLARESIDSPFINAKYNDTKANYTMRQAGMELAKQSKYNLQQAMLGNEAQYLHR